MNLIDLLAGQGTKAYLAGFSALDEFFHLPPAPAGMLFVEGSIVDCARAFPGLEYPGIEQADAVLRNEGRSVYVRCSEAFPSKNPAAQLNLLYDPIGVKFLDPAGIYQHLRAEEIVELDAALPTDEPAELSAVDAAILVSRYHYRSPGRDTRLVVPSGLKPFEQRDILSLILTGREPGRGFDLLLSSGFVKTYWPELFRMKDVSHSKEYHPEGDAWAHTMETFKYRKSFDLLTSLALLLHDAGKPDARKQEGRAFDGHAEIGAKVAASFLRRLEFPEPLRGDTLFLVRHHMLPGNLKILPVHRTENVLTSELFPVLLEVYRCDLSSTFRGPGGYYEACEKYRAFLKHRRNPFRAMDGRKLQRLTEMKS
jgi:poly(A) polymerase